MTLVTSCPRPAIALQGDGLGHEIFAANNGGIRGAIIGPTNKQTTRWFYHLRSEQNAWTFCVSTRFAACFSLVPTLWWAQERNLTPPVIGGAGLAAPYSCRAGSTLVVGPARHEEHITRKVYGTK